MSFENSNFDMTPDEKMEAVASLKRNMEDNFVQLGQLLSDIRSVSSMWMNIRQKRSDWIS